MNITVDQGQMLVSSIDLVSDEDDFKVFSVDLTSKYPGRPWHESDDDSIKVFIPEGEYSIKMEPAAKTITGITIPVDNKDDDWKVVSENTGRYTVVIVLYHERQRKEVWLNDDDETYHITRGTG